MNGIKEIDKRMQHLRKQTSGLRGAVLRTVDPQGYARKQQELKQLTLEYFRYFYGASTNPFP